MAEAVSRFVAMARGDFSETRLESPSHAAAYIGPHARLPEARVGVRAASVSLVSYRGHMTSII
jgi:hypothetical protein